MQYGFQKTSRTWVMYTSLKIHHDMIDFGSELENRGETPHWSEPLLMGNRNMEIECLHPAGYSGW